jgi:hypothetical protein
MNKLQESIAELRKAGDHLMFSLKLCEIPPAGIFHRPRISDFSYPYWNTVYGSRRHLTNEPIAHLPSDFEVPLKAVFSVLRSCIRAADPPKSDLKLLTELLNDSSVELEATRAGGLVYISTGSSLLKTLVEDLIRYVNCLAENPPLKPYEPIGVCVRCDGIFMKRRTNQEFCSNACRSAAWATAKGKEYFAERARVSRAARKAQRKSHLPSQKP